MGLYNPDFWLTDKTEMLYTQHPCNKYLVVLNFQHTEAQLEPDTILGVGTVPIQTNVASFLWSVQSLWEYGH